MLSINLMPETNSEFADPIYEDSNRATAESRENAMGKVFSAKAL